MAADLTPREFDNGINPNHFHSPESDTQKPRHLEIVGHTALVADELSRVPDPIFGMSIHNTPEQDVEELDQGRTALRKQAEESLDNFTIDANNLQKRASKRPAATVVSLVDDLMRKFKDRMVSDGEQAWVDFVNDSSETRNQEALSGIDGRPFAMEIAKRVDDQGRRETVIIDNRDDYREIKVFGSGNLRKLEVVVAPRQMPKQAITDPAQQTRQVLQVIRDISEVLSTVSVHDHPRARGLAMRHISNRGPLLSSDERKHLGAGMTNFHNSASY